MEKAGVCPAFSLYAGSGRLKESLEIGEKRGGIDAVGCGLSHLIGKSENLTVVTNEVFSGGADYDAESLQYMRNLADLNRMLAARADLVVELVCGLPNVWKGELP